METALYLVVGLIAGAGVAVLAIKVMGNGALSKGRAEGEQIKNNAMAEAQNKAKEIELAARQEQIKRKEQFERDIEQKRNELKSLEGRLEKREDTVDRKLDTLSVKEKNLDQAENACHAAGEVHFRQGRAA